MLRLLRGESLDLLARKTGQSAGRIASRREEFLAAGREGLKSRLLPVEERALQDAQRKVGELSLEVDILKRCRRKRATLSGRGARGERAAARAAEDGVSGCWRVPVGAIIDRELLGAIRRVLADSPFVGEGQCCA